VDDGLGCIMKTIPRMNRYDSLSWRTSDLRDAVLDMLTWHRRNEMMLMLILGNLLMRQ
jgi:hypothetical protein